MKGQYQTKNRQLLLDYLRGTAGGHVTAQELQEYFKARGHSMGAATVYRQLDRMVEEGLVNKYLVEGSSAAYYEYVNHEHCGEETCFHCKCERCGKLIHLHCHELEQLQGHIMHHHGFRLNPVHTVFYGICEDCT